jgi:putative membrane protein
VLSLPITSADFSKEKLRETQKRMIYRHIAWLHALRIQLRKTTPFSPQVNPIAKRFLNTHLPDEKIKDALSPYLAQDELEDVTGRQNPATHINKNQAFDMRLLRDMGCINSLDHQMLMGCVEENYNLQGKCERIKNTPFPRQYAYF